MFGISSIWHWLIVLAIVLLLFGAGKIPKLMGDVAKGVKAFKKGLTEEEEEAAAASPRIDTPPPTATPTEIRSVDRDTAKQ